MTAPNWREIHPMLGQNHGCVILREMWIGIQFHKQMVQACSLSLGVPSEHQHTTYLRPLVYGRPELQEVRHQVKTRTDFPFVQDRKSVV